jgi:hypothetical protein
VKFSQRTLYILVNLLREGLMRRGDGFGGVDNALPWDLEDAVVAIGGLY